MTNKKIILFLLFILLLGLKGNSQNLKFGLKSGLNIINVIEPNANLSQPSRLSFNIEFFCNYRFNRTFQAQIEPGFIEKGSWTTSHKENYTRYGYLTLPTLIIIKPIKRLNIEIGGEFNYLLYSKEKYLNGSLIDAPYQEYFNHFEFSGLAGISYNLAKNVQLGFRFGRAFTPLYHNTLFIWSPHHKFYNRYYELFFRMNLFSVPEF